MGLENSARKGIGAIVESISIAVGLQGISAGEELVRIGDPIAVGVREIGSRAVQALL